MHLTKKMKLLENNVWLHQYAPVRDKSLPVAATPEAIITRYAVACGEE